MSLTGRNCEEGSGIGRGGGERRKEICRREVGGSGEREEGVRCRVE